MVRTKCRLLFTLILATCTVAVAQKDSPIDASADAVVPPVVNLSGALTDTAGKPLTGLHGVTFALYKESEGGAPLWLETQNVQTDSKGRYTVVLGSPSTHGLPPELFASGDARWLGVRAQGEDERPRILLLSVPYALKALDAQTLGGRPASSFLSAIGSSQTPGANVTGSGTKNFIPRWTAATTIGNSNIFENANQVGIGTTSPAATLDVKGGADIRNTLTLFPNGSNPTLKLSGTAFAIGSSGKVTFVSGQTFPGTGTITGVTAQDPITGGGASGNVKVGLTTACSNNQILQWNGSKWICSSAGTGTITGVTAGTDLKGGGKSGNVTLSLDTGKVPQLASANTFTAAQKVNTNSATSSLTINNAGTGLGISASSSGSYAILGESAKDTDFFTGILGFEDGVNTKTVGVYGYTSGNTGMGVYGQNVAGSSVLFLPPYAGVWGDSSDGEGLIGTSDNYLAIQGINNTDLYPTLLLENETNDSVFGTLLTAYDSNVGGSCTIDALGDVSCSGQFFGGQPVEGGKRKIGMPAVEATENWFEDAGSAQLSQGSTTVRFDSLFAQTVNTGVEYHVFLTPKDDCEGLYVSHETAEGFEVHELRHGQSSIAFDYRIMAKRRGYENARLVDVTQKMRIPDGPPGMKGVRQARPVHVPAPDVSRLSSGSPVGMR